MIDAPKPSAEQQLHKPYCDMKSKSVLAVGHIFLALVR
uniref:Uncharacterized protein n=1 Tax=Rhizophora mucronata TaxID=61149 RepID=A0A2P2R3Z1_RHIMU